MSGGTPDSEVAEPGTVSASGYESGATLAQDEVMYKPIRILLQTTIPATEDDCHAGCFSLLGDHLASLSDRRPLCEATARDRGRTLTATTWWG